MVLSATTPRIEATVLSIVNKTYPGRRGLSNGQTTTPDRVISLRSVVPAPRFCSARYVHRAVPRAPLFEPQSQHRKPHCSPAFPPRRFLNIVIVPLSHQSVFLGPDTICPNEFSPLQVRSPGIFSREPQPARLQPSSISPYTRIQSIPDNFTINRNEIFFYLNLPTMTEAFCPPKPKAFDIAASTFTLRAFSGT